MRILWIGFLAALTFQANALPELQELTRDGKARLDATYEAILATEPADKLEACLSVEPLDRTFIRECMRAAYEDCAFGDGIEHTCGTRN